jgi:hypothetical protein
VSFSFFDENFPIIDLIGTYCLSVRDTDQQRGPHVKHYKIKFENSKIGYYIAARRTFPTLEALIDYYSSK